MADFKEAFNITKAIEGGYSNDPLDRGGETYSGISRKNFPAWSGWLVLDQHKLDKSNFPTNVYSDEGLNILVKAFYKKEFWDINSLDNFSSQLIANEMYDTGVNFGVVSVALILQESLNFLNKNGKLYSDLKVDGKIGPGTIKALDICINKQGEDYIYKVMNILQGKRYLDIMKNDPSQECFAFGWLNRVQFYKG